MSYKLVPPGKRHGNTVYYARIAVPGKRVEISTHTADKGLAEKYARRYEANLYERYVLGGGEAKTVADAIDLYKAFRRPRKQDEDYLLAIRDLIGSIGVGDVTQAHFDATAQALYPGRSNETWNRCVYTPLQAALRHSGKALLLKRPKQKKPRHRSLTADQRDTLIVAAQADPDLQALLAVMFFTAARISEAIHLTWDRVDLRGKKVCFNVTKQNEDQWRPLHDRVVVALANLPGERKGRVFRWDTRSGPRKAIAGLIRVTGIPFSPHVARHTFGDLIIESGASLRDMMDGGGWKSEKAAMRYTSRRVDRVRRAVDKL